MPPADAEPPAADDGPLLAPPQVADYQAGDLGVLNELTYPVWLITAWPTTHVWANQATLDAFSSKEKITLESFVNRDLVSTQSPAVKKRMVDWQERLDRGEIVQSQHTLYPNGKPPLTINMTMREFRLTQDDGSQRKVALIEGIPVKVQPELVRSLEMLRHSPVMTRLFSREDATVVEANPAAKAYYRAVAQQVDGNDQSLRVWLDDDEYDLMMAALRDKQPFSIRKAVVPLDGDRERWHEWVAIPTLDPVTGKEAVLVNETDVTRLSRVELELQEEYKRKDKFFSAVSHELRTPLNGIIGLSDAIVAGSCGDISDNERLVKTLKTIHISGRRLANLVNDILDAQQLKQKKIILKIDKVELRALVDDVVELSKPVLKRRVEIVNEVPESLPQFEADRNRITQILHNLVGNAAKFTEEGSISIGAETANDGQLISIYVKDTGIGIPKDKLDAIFLPFEQVDGSTTRKYGGTGLGLAIAQDLVSAHNGQIVVESEFGKGTCFRFSIPMTQPEAESEAIPMPPTPASPANDHLRPVRLSSADHKYARKDEGPRSSVAANPAADGKEKSHALSRLKMGDSSPSIPVRKPSSAEHKGVVEVLSVDDDSVNNAVVQNLLSPIGYKVTAVSSGMEALQLLQNREYLPDIVLLDCMMPQISGYEVCNRLRTMFPTTALPVIMVSSRSRQAHIVEGLASGCNDYVSKPFQPQELIARINTQLKLKDRWASEMQDEANLKLIEQFVPPSVITRMRTGQQVGAEKHDEITMLVCDIVGFSVLATCVPTLELIKAVNALFEEFDQIAERAGVFKVQGAGDPYIVVCGHDGSPNHTEKLLRVAQDFLKATAKITLPQPKPDEANEGKISAPPPKLEVRIGMHTGPAFAGLIGTKVPRYVFFGDTVLMAGLLEENGFPNSVQVSAAVQRKVQSHEQFQFGRVGHRKLPTFTGDAVTAETFVVKAGEWEEALKHAAEMDAELETITSSDKSGGDTKAGNAYRRLVRKRTVSSIEEVGRRSSMQEMVTAVQGELEVRAEKETKLEAKLAAAEARIKELESANEDLSVDKSALQIRVDEIQDRLTTVNKELEDRVLRPPNSSRTSSNGQESQQATARGASPAPNSIQLGEDVEILSVDDDAVNQTVVENLLAGHATVTTAMDGMEALEYLASHAATGKFPVDLILLDVMMPVMNGYEVCKEIRSRYPNNPVPIIMVSAKGREEAIVEGLKCGASDYVTKPFSRHELLARIETQYKLSKLWKIEVDASRQKALLDQLLPPNISERLADGENVIAEHHPSLTCLFSDIVGFTTAAGRLPTADLILGLNNMFSIYDKLVDFHNVYKVETIGDAYMVVAGHDNRPDHLARVLAFAKDMIARTVGLKWTDGTPMRIRVGLATGAAYGGVIGQKMPRYTFFGQTIIRASRMESNGFTMAIHFGEDVYNLLSDKQSDAHYLGERKIKGKGVLKTYLHKSGEWEEARQAFEAAKADAANDDDASAHALLSRSIVSANSREPPTPVLRPDSDSDNEGGDDGGGSNVMHEAARRLAGHNAGDVQELTAKLEETMRQRDHLEASKRGLEATLDELNKKLRILESTRPRADGRRSSRSGVSGDKEVTMVKWQLEFVEARLDEATRELKTALQEQGSLRTALEFTEARLREEQDRVRELESITSSTSSQLQLLGPAATGLLGNGVDPDESPRDSRFPALRRPTTQSSRLPALAPRTYGPRSRGVRTRPAFGSRIGTAAAPVGPFAPPPPPADDNQLATCFQQWGLDAYIDLFEAHQISLQMIPFLTEDQLDKLGITTVGDRERIRMAGKAAYFAQVGGV